jgi:acetoacetyl-CoA synthetase
MEPHLLWAPSLNFKEQSNLHHYIQWLREKLNLSFDDYDALWTWSIEHTDAFWKSLWTYFDILHDGSFQSVAAGDMPHTQWFAGTKLNYAEHIFRRSNDQYPAIVFGSESHRPQVISWQGLRERVAALQHFLITHNIHTGDRIVGYLPCIPEATVAFLATNALGAIWSSCSPDFGLQAVIDRFAQIEPLVLIAVDHYQYNGKVFDKRDVIASLRKALPTLKHVIVISADTHTVAPDTISWQEIMTVTSDNLVFARVPFNHPMWVLYSSGTTGLPKAITHSHGGILLEQFKYGTFHNDFKVGERCFWYTTTGWMMWNYIHGSLLAGGTMVLYDGSPGYPDLDVLWKFADNAGIHHFGTSAGFILACMKAGLQPKKSLSFSALRSIGSTGSTLPPEGFEWVYEHIKKDIWLASMSGGTDVCSAFVGGNPMWPVYAGEIQCRALGCALEAFNNNGEPIANEVGEMVITAPMPSMPIYFWNDRDFSRYHDSYFSTYPGIWRHGDWIEITDRKGIIIYGRSDATLNRGGVRIGTSEVYRAVDKIKEVKDSLIVCIEKNDGEFWMPLFVVLHDGVTLSDELRKKINQTIRADYSPRHVPDEIIPVPDIPYTLSGKKTETPVKKLLMGKPLEEVLNVGALRNPEAMKFFSSLPKTN